jgi:hypothetical protein
MGLFFLSLFAAAIIALIASHVYAARLRSREFAANTRKIADVTGLSITLEIDGKSALYILLAADGSINRMGTGTLDNAEQELFIGITHTAVFEAVRSHLTAEMWQYLGHTLQSRNPRGASCKLTILVQCRDGTSNGFAFCYGADSEGPPKFVADFVTAAVRESDLWYEDFKRAAARRKNP